MNLKKIELILIVLFVIALLLDFVFLVSAGGLLVVMAIGGLSMIYFYGGFSIFNAAAKGAEDKLEKTPGIAVNIIAGLVFSIVMVGLLFKIQTWGGASWFLNVALTALCVLCLIMGFIYFKTQTYNPMLLKRVLIYGGLLVVLSMLPQFTLLNLKYRAHPEYADALKKSIANPGDTTLRAKVDAERVKMNR